MKTKSMIMAFVALLFVCDMQSIYAQGSDRKRVTKEVVFHNFAPPRTDADGPFFQADFNMVALQGWGYNYCDMEIHNAKLHSYMNYRYQGKVYNAAHPAFQQFGKLDVKNLHKVNAYLDVKLEFGGAGKFVTKKMHLSGVAQVNGKDYGVDFLKQWGTVSIYYGSAAQGRYEGRDYEAERAIKSWLQGEKKKEDDAARQKKEQQQKEQQQKEQQQKEQQQKEQQRIEQQRIEQQRKEQQQKEQQQKQQQQGTAQSGGASGTPTTGPSKTPVYGPSTPGRDIPDAKTYWAVDPITNEKRYFTTAQQRDSWQAQRLAQFNAGKQKQAQATQAQKQAQLQEQQAAKQAQQQAAREQQAAQTRARLEEMKRQQRVIQEHANQAATEMAGVIGGSYATENQKNMAIAQAAGRVTGLVAGKTGNMAAGVGAGLGVAALGGLFGSSQESRARKEAEEARQAEEAERRRLEREMEAMRVAAIRETRKLMFSEFTDIALPLSSQQVRGNQFYYFAYRIEPGVIEADKPRIFVTNLFAVSKYADGSWPYTNTIKREILSAGGQGDLILTGMYESESLAQSWYQQFIEMAASSEITIEQLQYKGKASASASAGSSTSAGSSSAASSSASDFWETGSSSAKTPAKAKATPKSSTSSSAKADDFWNQ